MRIIVRDISPDFCQAAVAWIDNADIAVGSIVEVNCDAVVSPANSFGFMDGGVDYVYTKHFGLEVQNRVQLALECRPFGELLVGEAIVIATDNANIPFLISAPTMRVPKLIQDPADIMLAARAAVAAARAHGLGSVAFPGMGTGCGGLPFGVAARAMAAGIRAALKGVKPPQSWREAQASHFGLTSSIG